MAVADGTATIEIHGVLTKKPNFMAFLFGGGNATYADIQSSIAKVEADPTVTAVRFDIDSPGGEIDGLFETIAAIEAMEKPRSVVSSMAASAAYAIAASVGNIRAKSPASMFGSIGVVVGYHADDGIIEITSTDAPNKRPDVKTEEGKAVVVEMLDKIHDLFVGAISRGRDKTPHVINTTFGRGGVVLAAEAKKLGMIDHLVARPKRAAVVALDAPPITDEQTTPAAVSDPEIATADHGGALKTKARKMTKEELKAQFPELYSALVAEGFEAGKADGVTLERKRVSAHLTLAKSTGAMDIALEAIPSGVSSMDEDVHARYLAAAIDRREQTDRQDDSESADGATGSVSAEDESKDFGDLVADAFEARGALKWRTALSPTLIPAPSR